MTEPARNILAEHDRNRWASVLIAAFHRVGASRELHRSLLGVLAIGRETAGQCRVQNEPTKSLQSEPTESCPPSSRGDTGGFPTQHSAPSTQHSAPSPQHPPMSDTAVSPTHDPSLITHHSPTATSPATALTSAEQAALAETAAVLTPGPVSARPKTLASIRAMFHLRSKRARQTALLVCLACLSAIAGTASSCLNVNIDEAVIVQRFGRVVAICGPGLHFRPLWPVESLTRLQPGLVRQVRIGSPPDETAPSSRITGERASNLFLTSDAALSVSGRVEYTVNDVEAFAFALDDPDRLVLATAEAALVETLAGHSALWVLGPERSLLTARLRECVQQRLTALGSGIHIHGLILDDLSLPRGTATIDVDAAFRGVTMAETDKAAAIRKAKVESERSMAEAKARASELVNAAETERTRSVEAARTLAQRVQDHLQAFRENPAQVREQLILNLILKDSSGHPKILVDPALDDKVQFMVGNVDSPSPPQPSRPESRPAAATRPAGGAP